MSGSTPLRRSLAAALAAFASLTLSGVAQAGSATPQNHWTAPFSHAPAYHEIVPAAGAPNHRRPRAVMLVIPGGGWQALSRQAVTDMRPYAATWQARGFMTVSLTYRPGELSITDTAWFYRHARARFGKRVPICASGGSAGGHLSLELAVRFPRLACVVSHAGPTDLPALRSEAAPVWGYAQQAFGDDAWRYSPIRVCQRLRARTLLVAARTDALVPAEQTTAFKPTCRKRTTAPIWTVLLDGDGTESYVHGTVTAADAIRYLHAEDVVARKTLADAARRPPHRHHRPRARSNRHAPRAGWL